MLRRTLVMAMSDVTEVGYLELHAIVKAKMRPVGGTAASKPPESASNAGIRSTLIVDVRTVSEVVRTGMIPSAVLIPLQVLGDILARPQGSRTNVFTGDREDFNLDQEDERLISILYPAAGDTGSVYGFAPEGTECPLVAEHTTIRNATGAAAPETYALDLAMAPRLPPLKHYHYLLFYCAAGVRSRAAAAMAQELGYRAGHYPGGFRQWHCYSKSQAYRTQ